MWTLWNKIYSMLTVFENLIKWALKLINWSIDTDSGLVGYVLTTLMLFYFSSDWLWPYCGLTKRRQKWDITLEYKVFKLELPKNVLLDKNHIDRWKNRKILGGKSGVILTRPYSVYLPPSCTTTWMINLTVPSPALLPWAFEICFIRNAIKECS